MGKRDDFWETLSYDEEDAIRWPEEPLPRATLVRDVFGATVIGALESVLEDGLAAAAGQPPQPGASDYEVEAERRRVMASLSEEQRAEVCRLLKESCFGTLYWILVKLEHFPQGSVDFTVEPFSSQGVAFPAVGIKALELHHPYFDWVERFSDHGAT